MASPSLVKIIDDQEREIAALRKEVDRLNTGLFDLAEWFNQKIERKEYWELSGRRKPLPILDIVKSYIALLEARAQGLLEDLAKAKSEIESRDQRITTLVDRRTNLSEALRSLYSHVDAFLREEQFVHNTDAVEKVMNNVALVLEGEPLKQEQLDLYFFPADRPISTAVEEIKSEIRAALKSALEQERTERSDSLDSEVRLRLSSDHRRISEYWKTYGHGANLVGLNVLDAETIPHLDEDCDWCRNLRDRIRSRTQVDPDPEAVGGPPYDEVDMRSIFTHIADMPKSAGRRRHRGDCAGREPGGRCDCS